MDEDHLVRKEERHFRRVVESRRKQAGNRNGSPKIAQQLQALIDTRPICRWLWWRIRMCYRIRAHALPGLRLGGCICLIFAVKVKQLVGCGVCPETFSKQKLGDVLLKIVRLMESFRVVYSSATIEV
jgi:hypothetical protein